MKKVLVVGATGAMGRYLVPFLANKGYKVTALSLDDQKPYNENVTCIKGNAKDKEFLTKVLEEKFDGIVDFMCYHNHDFPDFYETYLNNTSHYIFLSSCRVYDDKEHPITENSPRLLDSSDDEVLKQSNDYCIYKAHAENLLRASKYDNWTIVRPATTFSTMRLQLVTLEFVNCVARALKGKKVVLPIQAKDKPATLSWGGDVAKMIGSLLFNDNAKKETYNVCSSEWRTWGEIAEYYHKLVGLEAEWVDKEDYLAILNPQIPLGVRWQLEYARMFTRITDNSKVLKETGLKQEEFKTMFDGLAYEIGNIPEGYEFPDTEVGKRMDEYLAKHNL